MFCVVYGKDVRKRRYECQNIGSVSIWSRDIRAPSRKARMGQWQNDKSKHISDGVSLLSAPSR